MHAKLELTQCVPKLKRIRQLLEVNPYRGRFDDDEDDENPKAKVLFSVLTGLTSNNSISTL